MLVVAGCGTFASSTSTTGALPDTSASSVAMSAVSTENSTSTKSSDIKPDLASWAGKGDIALIYNDKATEGMDGGKLYTILDKDQGPERFEITDHVISANFSPNGKWLSVLTLEQRTSGSKSLGSTNSEQPIQVLWLMSSDGQVKQKLLTGTVVPGAWVTESVSTGDSGNAGDTSDTYVYGSNPIFSVKPGQKPVQLSDKLPSNTNALQYEANKLTNSIAIVMASPTPGKDMTQRFDSIGVLNPDTGSVRILKKGKPSEGFVLGPWLNMSTLFYWPDPMHSASLLADGSELSTITLDGKTEKITTTLVGQGSVGTSGFGKSDGLSKAAIQVGPGRTLFTSKTIGLWDGQTLELLPHDDHSVAFWPTIDQKGTQVAFDEGPELLPNAATSDTQTWWQQLQLGTYDVQTRQTNILKAAGQGVILPQYNKSGDAIVYLENNSLYWISSDGEGNAHKVANFGGNVWNPYPQMGSTMSLEIEDYLP